jgi:hypothetical protein
MGGFGPQPHPGFIEVFGEAAFDNGDGALAGAEEDESTPTAWVREFGEDRADDYGRVLPGREAEDRPPQTAPSPDLSPLVVTADRVCCAI